MTFKGREHRAGMGRAHVRLSESSEASCDFSSLEIYGDAQCVSILQHLHTSSCPLRADTFISKAPTF